MQKATPIVFAASLSAGLLLTAGCEDRTETVDTTAPPVVAPAADAREGADTARTAGERAGDVGEMIPDSVYEVLAEATEAAVKEGTFSDLVERFAANDRGRFANVGDAELQPLNSAARTIAGAYQGKYGGDFNIEQPAAVFRPLVNLQPKGKTDDRMFLRVELQPKRQNVPPYDITMIKDTTWHIDIPDNYDAASLRQELVQHLGRIGQGSEAWPADKVEAQRLVAYHVLAALANSRVGGIESDAPGTSNAQATPNNQ